MSFHSFECYSKAIKTKPRARHNFLEGWREGVHRRRTDEFWKSRTDGCKWRASTQTGSICH